MAITPYCSKDEYAYKRAKEDWADYTGSPIGNTFEYPYPEGLDDMLEEATAYINTEMGRSEASNLTTHTTYLRNLCYKMVRLMEQEELGEEEGNYNTFIPKDYMYERDRNRLHRFGRESGHLKLGGVTSG